MASKPTKKAMAEVADIARALAQLLLTAARENLPELAPNPMVPEYGEPQLFLLISSVACRSDAEASAAIQRWAEYLQEPVVVGEPSMAGTPNEYRQLTVTTVIGGLPVVIWTSEDGPFREPGAPVGDEDEPAVATELLREAAGTEVDR